MRAGRSLKLQLTMLCVGLLVPTLAFVGFLLWQVTTSERSRIEEQARELSRGLAFALDREIIGVLTTLQALATSPSLQTRDLAAFYAQVTEIRRLQGIHISLRSVDGYTVLTTRAPFGAAVPVPALLAETDRDILRSGAATVSNVFVSATSRAPVFQIVTAPVLVGGVRTYLLAASIDLIYLADAIKNANLPPGWIGALVDKNGIFAVRTERQEEFAGKSTSQTFRSRVVGESGSYYGRNTAGDLVLAGYARSGLTGWIASANIKSEAVDAPLRRSLMLLIGLGAILVLMAAAIALAMGRRVDQAMHRLGMAAASIGQGQTLEPLVTPITEVNQVGQALATASHQLQDRARERDEAEASLREREEALRELNETLETQVAERTRERDRAWRNSRDLQIVLDRAGTLQAVSPAVASLLGWAGQEVVGRPVSDFIHPDDTASTAGALAQSAEDVPPEFESRWRHKDGSFRWLSWVAAAEEDRIYASGRDIGAQKEQAEALHQAEAALRQVQKMEAVGQLTGGIAHDFNNLLAGIVGSIELMQAHIGQGRMDAIERYAKAAMGSAQRAAALTHRLLAFSRRQPLDPRPVDANALAAGMGDLIRRTIGPLHAFEFVTSGGLWITLCDPHQLENAILNLVINARDAMPHGGKITLETSNARLDDAYAAKQRDVTPGQYVCVAISDNGTGMTEEVAARAFEPFFTTKPMGQGTGLGLSMVYGFARQSEGQLKIYSEVGRGTTVKIYLPRHQGMLPKERDNVRMARDAAQAEPGQTVLVVEDEPVIRDLIVEVLQDLGYRALDAADGPAGLRILQSRERIDLVVTDVGLPGLNGRQLVDQARQTRPQLKALFITGYAENATVANGFLDPGMEMITKPFSVQALADKIGRMVRDS